MSEWLKEQTRPLTLNAGHQRRRTAEGGWLSGAPSAQYAHSPLDPLGGLRADRREAAACEKISESGISTNRSHMTLTVRNSRCTSRGVGAIQPFEDGVRIAEPGMHQGKRIWRDVPLTGCQVQCAPVAAVSITGARIADVNRDGRPVFRSLEANTNRLIRIKKDGMGPERITTAPVLNKYGVSRDGEWVLIGSPGAGVDAVPATLAVPIRGSGPPRKICAPACQAGWSSDGKFFYVSLDPSAMTSPGNPGKVLAIPVPAGKSLPELPVSGINLVAALPELPGARVIEHGSPSTGPDPSTFVFTKTDLQRNLFRIPLH